MEINVSMFKLEREVWQESSRRVAEVRTLVLFQRKKRKKKAFLIKGEKKKSCLTFVNH